MKYPLDTTGIQSITRDIYEHHRAQEAHIMQLSMLLREALQYVEDDGLKERSNEAMKELRTRKLDFENFRFNQKNGHFVEDSSPYDKLPSNMATVHSQENDSDTLTVEELARHFNEPLPKKKPVEKQVSEMSLEEIAEWEAKQENSNDIYKVSARVKNLARSDGGSLTPMGESLCNLYTHVIKTFYDFAEGLKDREIKIKLVELIRKQEGMPGNLISLAEHKIKI